MPTTVLIVLGVLLAVAALASILLYSRYSGSPAAIWKRRVQAAVAEWEKRKQGLTHPTGTSVEAQELALREKYFAQHLQSISVDRLMNYPGIGPVTVSKLRDAGFADLAGLTPGNVSSVQNLGPARLKDLRSALEDAKREAKSQFDAGACPAAVAMTVEKKAQEAERIRQQEAAREATKEADLALAYLAEPRRVAGKISFIRFLARRPTVDLNEALLARSLSPPPVLRVAKPASVEPVPTLPVAVVQPTPVAVSPLDRLRAVAAFGYAVAKVDGRIAASERRQIRVFLERRYASTADLRETIDTTVTEIEKDVPPLDQAIAEVCRTISGAALAELHQFAISVVDASGQRNAREDQCLARIAESLSISPGPTRPVETSQPASSESWTEIDCRTKLEIGLETPLNVELIRRQYHLLADRFAPSKFSNHGTEFVTMAAEKRANVERAARQLIAAFNEPLEAPAAAQPADLRHNPDLDAVFG